MRRLAFLLMRELLWSRLTTGYCLAIHHYNLKIWLFLNFERPDKISGLVKKLFVCWHPLLLLLLLLTKQFQAEYFGFFVCRHPGGFRKSGQLDFHHIMILNHHCHEKSSSGFEGSGSSIDMGEGQHWVFWWRSWPGGPGGGNNSYDDGDLVFASRWQSLVRVPGAGRCHSKWWEKPD